MSRWITWCKITCLPISLIQQSLARVHTSLLAHSTYRQALLALENIVSVFALQTILDPLSYLSPPTRFFLSNSTCQLQLVLCFYGIFSWTELETGGTSEHPPPSFEGFPPFQTMSRWPGERLQRSPPLSPPKKVATSMEDFPNQILRPSSPQAPLPQWHHCMWSLRPFSDVRSKTGKIWRNISFESFWSHFFNGWLWTGFSEMGLLSCIWISEDQRLSPGLQMVQRWLPIKPTIP